MVGLPGLKELFLEYKRLKSLGDDVKAKELYGDMIVNTDYLILYFIKQCRKRLGYLRGIEIEDLYHDGIIALHNAAVTFPDNMSEEYIPCRLRAYMLAQFRKIYRYIDKENVEIDQGEYQRYNSIDNINLDKIDYDAILATLSPEEAELVDSYMTSKKQVQQLAKERNVSSPRISGKIKDIINRFKKG